MNHTSLAENRAATNSCSHARSYHISVQRARAAQDRVAGRRGQLAAVGVNVQHSCAGASELPLDFVLHGSHFLNGDAHGKVFLHPSLPLLLQARGLHLSGTASSSISDGCEDVSSTISSTDLSELPAVIQKSESRLKIPEPLSQKRLTGSPANKGKGGCLLVTKHLKYI
jgi:hypothetical protein